MSYTPVQSDIDMLFQPVKKRKIKIELLNKDFHVLEMLEGNCISDSFSIDSSATSRRNYNCDLYITNSTFLVGKDKKIWFDKYIRPYIGIYNLRTKEYVWYLKGTFSYDSADYNYDESSNTLSLSCLDLMCMLSGDRNGRQAGLTFTIPVGEDVRTAIIGIIKIFGFTKYRIDIGDVKVPYDLEYSANASAYDMLTDLVELCTNYEFFFDLDGTFVVQRKPCYTNDIRILDDDILQRLKTSDSENYSLDFKNVKNCIEVWGKEFDVDLLSGFADTEYNNGVYSVTYETLVNLTDYTLIGITANASNEANSKICINNKWTFDLINRYNQFLSPGDIQSGYSYIFLYQSNNLYFLGSFQIHAIFKNEISDSPFSISNIGEEIWEIKSGTDYENILSDAEALERAMYECYQSNFNESLSFTIEDIPWLDVNQKVSYKAKNVNSDEAVDWLITSISGSATDDGGTINLSLVRFYPDWSEIYNKMNAR